MQTVAMPGPPSIVSGHIFLLHRFLTIFITKSSRRTSITPEETTALPSKPRSFPHASSKDTRHCMSFFYLSIVTCQLSQIPRQKVSPHRPIAEPEQTRPHTVSASLPRRRIIAHQAHGGLPRPPSQQHPCTLDFDIQVCNPATAKDAHVSPTTALAAERRGHAQH